MSESVEGCLHKLSFGHYRVEESVPHDIYYELVGPESATKTALFLHGGPGSGFRESAKYFFRGLKCKVLYIDQRGAGRSTPAACLVKNDTPSLVSDIEKLRAHCGISHFDVVVGGSWGSTLALAYAESHSSSVHALVMWGIFTGRKMEIDWLYRQGASFLRPEAFREYMRCLAELEGGGGEGASSAVSAVSSASSASSSASSSSSSSASSASSDPLTGYYKCLTSSDAAVRLRAARAFSRWEASCSCMEPTASMLTSSEDADFAVKRSTIEAHYFVNGCFFDRDDALIANAHKIAHIPTVLVSGRYDLVCPIVTAIDLAAAMGPKTRMHVSPQAGHASIDPENYEAIVHGIQSFL